MNLFSYIKQHKLAAVFTIAVLVLVVSATAIRIQNKPASESAINIPAVSLISAANYHQERTIDLDNGSVESLGQADLKSQISAPIAQVNVRLGDTVSAGKTLVQLQNNDIKAQLEQAQAGLTAAESKLAELRRGARAQDVAISQSAADETRASLVNSIKDTYAKSDDSIHNHIDKFFVNPRENSADFIIEVGVSGSGKTEFKASDTELAARVERQKYEIEKMLVSWAETSAGLTSSSPADDLETALAQSRMNLQTEIDFLNDMAPLVNSISTDNTSYKTAIDGYKTEFSAARNTISGALASLQGAETSWRAAQKNLDLKLAGSSAEQIEQGKAAVAQAQASVNTAKATLAKTAITSPIAGKISYISGNIGEYVTSGTLIASVVNPGALQVKSYVSENDLRYISPGDPAAIDGGAKGLVQTVAPAVNDQTKKAEVNIVITENAPNPIVIGQTVSVSISTKNSSSQSSYLLPIETIQFTGNETYVFLVDVNGRIQKLPVVTGEIIGEKIYVTGGLNDDSQIVSSARGLQVGQTVRTR